MYRTRTHLRPSASDLRASAIEWRAAVAACLLALGSAACAPDAGGRSEADASRAGSGAGVRPLSGSLEALPAAPGPGSGLQLQPTGEPGSQDLVASLELPAASWKPLEVGPVRHAEPGVPLLALHAPSGLEVLVDGRPLAEIELPADNLGAAWAAGQLLDQPGWANVQGELFLVESGDGERPALPTQPATQPQVLLRARVSPGPTSRPAPHHLQLPGLAGRGTLFGTGLAWVAQADVQPGDRLMLGVALSADGAHPYAGPVQLRLSAGGRVIATRLLEPVPELRAEPWSVPLADSSGPLEGRLELRLEARGGPALGALSNPRLAPGPPSSAEARTERPPDLILFVADTFRADNLSAYRDPTTGFAPAPGWIPDALTPALDALAERSAVFREIWASSTWTLPSHASLFASLHPRQHTATRRGRRLPDAAQTLAETLHAAGYRTVAVTEGGFCSAAYGLEQGFEVFIENVEDLDSTLALAASQLDADDGRPVFLFVQTFRTHGPFTAESATLERLGIDFEPRYSIEQLDRHWRATTGSEVATAEMIDEHPDLLRRLEALYRGGVAEFDAQFGAWFDDLDRAGFFERGALAFTSDHGNAFGENGRLFHSSEAFESQLRVPLLLHGAGVDAGERGAPASLVDLAPTLAQLAGAPGPPDWIGRDLLGDAPAEALWASTDDTFRFPKSVARLSDGLKWMRIGPDGEPLWFELGPAGVERPFAGAPPAAPGTERLNWVLAPQLEPATARGGAEMRRQLARLGYFEADAAEPAAPNRDPR